MALPEPDLVILFRVLPAGTTPSTIKKQKIDNATAQYNRLLQTLKTGRLNAVGRRGEELGISWSLSRLPETLLGALVYAERHAFKLARIPLNAKSPAPSDLTAADRIRLVYTYITAVPQDGGLGIAKELPEWDCIESITALQSQHYNSLWLQEWTTHRVSLTQVTSLSKHFGAQVATYFSFLSWYTTFLHFPALLGGIFFILSRSDRYWLYHPLYSTLIVVWGTVWVQWWSVQEKKQEIQDGFAGDHPMPKNVLDRRDLPITPLNTTQPRLATYHEGDQWYHREGRVLLVGAPSVLAFIVMLGGLLTSIFLLEAFVAQIYSGPGAQVFPLVPTILFSLLVPNFVKLSTKFLEGMTQRENHRTRKGWDRSMALKVWALNATVAYLGLCLSAFVYIPFGDSILDHLGSRLGLIQEAAASSDLKAKLNPERLQNQMFAITVTQQIVNTFMEIGLPWVMKGVDIARGKVAKRTDKKLSHEDEKKSEGPEAKWLVEVREELKKPAYDVGTDYSEMVTQYGHLLLFSAVWPLAPVMALVNNIVELRSDAYKLSTHHRRPIPTTLRQTIGPWLTSLEVLTWLGSCVNGALCYLFWGAGTATGSHLSRYTSHKSVLRSALLSAALASHGYFVLRYIIRRIIWRAVLISSELGDNIGEDVGECWTGEKSVSDSEFWHRDEGLDDIARLKKDA
ncbi:calcium-activated chloride channel-domain-containing protein [Flagelloscypha sp. PMI_526]|nr:calcium-activated chloride channel-domain-containing protein [Flagelloscypha sp. PMI_526]